MKGSSLDIILAVAGPSFARDPRFGASEKSTTEFVQHAATRFYGPIHPAGRRGKRTGFEPKVPENIDGVVWGMLRQQELRMPRIREVSQRSVTILRYPGSGQVVVQQLT